MCKTPMLKTGMCYLMWDGRYCMIHDIQKGNDKVLCEVYTQTKSFYACPCDSRLLGIHKVSKRKSDMMYLRINDIKSFAIYFTLSIFNREECNTAVVIPLMHSL